MRPFVYSFLFVVPFVALFGSPQAQPDHVLAVEADEAAVDDGGWAGGVPGDLSDCTLSDWEQRLAQLVVTFDESGYNNSIDCETTEGVEFLGGYRCFRCQAFTRMGSSLC